MLQQGSDRLDRAAAIEVPSPLMICQIRGLGLLGDLPPHVSQDTECREGLWLPESLTAALSGLTAHLEEREILHIC